MKLKYFITGMLAASMLLSACVEVDEINRLDGVGTAQLNVKGFLNGSSIEYPSIIDPEAGTITVQVPYYISDTERIMGDLTQMKLEAQTPVGYSFSPSLAGIHDLMAGYRTNLLDDKGNAKSYTIYAEAVKSKDAGISSVVLTEMERATILVSAPQNDGENGKVSVYRTSSSVENALHSAIVTVSPWATYECVSFDPETGIVDLSGLPQIIVTAQDGVTKITYDVVFDYPNIKEYGAGYVANLFGFQMTVEDPHGFEADANTTMAVVDDYLIISNRFDVSKMLVLDRFTGKVLENVHVNTTGMPADRQFKAICTDDAGHLIAATYVNSNVYYNGGVITDPNVQIFAWVNGIENAPKSIVLANMNGGYFDNAPRGINNVVNYEMFNTITCKGDVTSGNAAIGTISKAHPRCVILPLVDGKLSSSKAFVEWGGNGTGWASMWDSSKCTMLTAQAPWSYVWDQGMARMGIYYLPEGTGSRCIYLEQPSSHWWKNPDPKTPNYAYVTRSHAIMDFNGARFLATSNGYNQGQEKWAFRLYVADIGMSPNSSSLETGFVFDSREGNLSGTDAIPGTGPLVTGMTSTVSFSGAGTILGMNSLQMNDVIFGKSDDGNAIQVYMLVHDQGLIGYEITRFDI